MSSKRSRAPTILRATTCPWRSATTQCSTRRRRSEYASGHRATSPAVKTSLALVSRNSLTARPLSSVRPAEAERDPVLLVDVHHEPSQLGPEYALERKRFWSGNVHLQSARDKRGCDLE